LDLAREPHLGYEISGDIFAVGAGEQPGLRERVRDRVLTLTGMRNLVVLYPGMSHEARRLLIIVVPLTKADHEDVQAEGEHESNVLLRRIG